MILYKGEIYPNEKQGELIASLKGDMLLTLEKGETLSYLTVIDACDHHSLEKVSPQCRNCPQEGDIGFIMLRSLMTCVELGHDDQGHKFITMVKKEQR